MKYLRILVLISAVLLVVAACGKKAGNEDSPESKTKGRSKETNEIGVVFSDQELRNPGPFELKKTLAFISGMRYSDGSTAKLVYVVFANYEAELGLYSIELPQEPGQIAILVSFKSENVEVPLEQQMDEYTKIKVETGIYEPTWMGTSKGFQVVYFLGGESDGDSISDQGASGTATLTISTSEKVGGSIDFTSPNGSTIKGVFNAKIDKDLWLN